MSQVRTNSIVPAGGLAGNGGGIIQIVSTTKTDTFNSSWNNSWVNITGMSATITPQSSSNKVFVLISISGHCTWDVGWQVIRDGAAITQGDVSGSRLSCMAEWPVANGTRTNEAGTSTMFFLDSPATTSSKTYQLRAWSNGQTVSLNRSGSDANSDDDMRSVSTITLMEISG